MILKCFINGKAVTADISPDMALLEFVRSQGCYSVKRGCETANCGLCTVWVDGTPVLSCSTPAMRVEGKKVTTLEGLQKEAEEFAKMPYGNEILVSLIVKKKPMKIAYETIRRQATDFPVIAVAVAKWEDAYHVSVGARPAKAAKIVVKQLEDEKAVAAEFTYGSNLRGSAEYRQHVAGVLIKRLHERLEEK